MTSVPFPPAQAIVLGYYDGPLDGFMRDSAGDAFLFEMLECDDDQHVRIYRIAPIDTPRLATFVADLSIHMTPNWPAWVPMWSFPDSTIQQDLERQIREVKASRGPWTAIFVSADFRTLIDARPWPGDQAAQSITDWFEFLRTSR